MYRTSQADVYVNGISHAVYHGYATREAAENAWGAVQQAGMVGSRDGALPQNIDLLSLPLVSDRVPPPSSLSTPGADRRFYVVYRGRFTGVFNSRYVHVYLSLWRTLTLLIAWSQV